MSATTSLQGVEVLDADFNPVGIGDGDATVAGQLGFISVGFDGSNYRFVRTNSSGQTIVVGAGTAGTPAGGVVTIQGVSGGVVVPIGDGGGSITIDTTQLPASLVGGRLNTNVGAWLGATTPTVGQKAMSASIPVVVASDQSAVSVQPVRSSTGTTSNVTASTSTVTILAANADRLGATVHNDSNRAMYLKAGASASTTSYTVDVPRRGYYEVPFHYTGILTAVWATGVTGTARVTEFT